MTHRRVGAALISIIVAFLAITTPAHADTPPQITEYCGPSAQLALGNYFTSYESSEYSPSGYLNIHFKNQNTNGASFPLATQFYDDQCNQSSQSPGQTGFGIYPIVTIPEGDADWSVRFTSMTHYDIWNDASSTIIAGYDISEYPSYTSVELEGTLSYFNNFNTFFSRGLKIKQDGAAPISTSQLPNTSTCDGITESGNFFDPSYEHAEYVDGLLRIHLRRNSPYSGATFYATGATYTPPETCGFAFTIMASYGPPTALPTDFIPHIRYFSFRMTSPTHWVFWDDEHDVQLVCTHCEGDIPAQTPFVFFYAQSNDRSNEIHSTPFPPTEPTTTLTPVIIIPGILGSAQHNGQWIIDPIAHIYDNLIDTLTANGYEKDKTLFTFPYDWHLSNVTSATLLKNKIDSVKAICGCNQVDLVTHSMGGLVARQYIQSGNYTHDVRKLIFLGTPQQGAPSAYLMWEDGETGGGADDNKLKIFLSIDAKKHGYASLFKYEHDLPIPSVQELLPVYGYIKHVGSTNIPPYPNSQWYPNNLFLYNLDANIASLYNSGVEISNFVGQTSVDKTITAIRVVATTTPSADAVWGFGKPENFGNNSTDQGLEWGVGDGIVPLSSADLVINDLNILDSEHNDLPTKAEGQIFKKISGRDAVTLISNDIGTTATLKNFLIFQILSPADIVVVAPDGRKVGKEFSSGQELNEIPGAFYSGFANGAEYVTIPNSVDGEYKVITQGIDNGGEYTIATGVIEDATSSMTFFTGTTLPNLITEHDIEVNTENPSNTTIHSADQTPPTITVIQPATTTYTHADFMSVNISFIDATGVASTSVAFDATKITASSTVDLFYQTLGNHTLSIFAQDLVNNATTSRRVIQVIATASSTQSDVSRAYGLGWITSKDLKNLIITQLNQIVKLQIVSTSVADPANPKKTKIATTVVKIVDKILLQAMGVELTLANKLKQVNAQGYQLLTADINWLNNH